MQKVERATEANRVLSSIFLWDLPLIYYFIYFLCITGR